MVDYPNYWTDNQMVGIEEGVTKRWGKITWGKDWKGIVWEKLRQKIENRGRRERKWHFIEENLSGEYPEEEEDSFNLCNNIYYVYYLHRIFQHEYFYILLFIYDTKKCYFEFAFLKLSFSKIAHFKIFWNRK